ncbi:hypothetical protein [Serinicoccus sp. LYQ131]|uniref:hypothetical protein n=1 Tax=Serinicoccus sp. LYQ131 TaxID=3378797 RepID=UPI00385433D1
MSSYPSFRDRPRIAVLTAASRDHDHLLGHVDGLAVSTWPPDAHVVVSVQDRALTRGRLPIRSDRWSTDVHVLASRHPHWLLPAMHLAAARALRHAPDVLIYLSVHCIPSPRLIRTLVEEAMANPSTAPTLWSGKVVPLMPCPGPAYPVRQLDELILQAPGIQEDSTSPPWSEAFAVRATDWSSVWSRVEQELPFTNDLAAVTQVLRDCGVQMRTVSGGVAYRQHGSPARTAVAAAAGA